MIGLLRTPLTQYEAQQKTGEQKTGQHGDEAIPAVTGIEKPSDGAAYAGTYIIKEQIQR